MPSHRRPLLGLAGTGMGVPIAICTGDDADGGDTPTATATTTETIMATRTETRAATETETQTRTETETGTRELTVEWDAGAGGRMGNGYHYPQPVLLEGTLVFATGLHEAGVLEGYNPDTGDREWEISTQTSMNSHHPVPCMSYHPVMEV